MNIVVNDLKQIMSDSNNAEFWFGTTGYSVKIIWNWEMFRNVWQK